MLLKILFATAAAVFASDCTAITSFGATVTRTPGTTVARAELHRVSVCQSDGTWSITETCPRGTQLFDRVQCWTQCENARAWNNFCNRMCACVPTTTTTITTTSAELFSARIRLGETRDQLGETGDYALGSTNNPEAQLGHGSSYEPTALVTTYFNRYPGYKGRQMIEGNVVVVSTGHSLTLVYNFNGLEYGTMGGFHIHEGMHCNDASTIGGHFYDHNQMHSDPWEQNKWRSMSNGFGEGVLEIDTGYSSLSYNNYHTVVVHTSDGTRAACAELRPLTPQAQPGYGYEPTALVTTYFKRYPGYHGYQNILGNVVVFTTGHSLVLVYNFNGLEYGTMGGFHIHEGKHCNDASTIGGHFYDHNQMHSDPWEQNKWRSMKTGFGEGVLEIETGYSSLSYNDYHTIVVHTSDGTRAACAELRPLQSRRRLEEPMRRLLANMS